MDGLEVAPRQDHTRGHYSQLQVAIEAEKEANNHAGDTYYVSGPIKAGPVTLEDGSPRAGSSSDSKRICGMRLSVLWLLLVIAVLVIGGAVGGGVGGSLANRNSNNSASTTAASTTPGNSASSIPQSSTTTASTTASTTSSAPVTSGTTGVAANPCPGRNLTTITGSDGSIFTLLCAVDWPKGVDSSSGNGTVSDLGFPSTEYSLKSCISQCVKWNEADSDEQCKGISYSANLTAAFDGGQEGNCFLKSSVGVYFPNSETGMSAGLLGG
ncbi:uncharacterized protein N7484_002418 [Penicillium longicatenatum]|uniref:uncharacterized protein n=1 Tax=Penicillium longicatenatum TaxID=1561947 RepID=UPI00254729CA|nr:uncharacterized protein N7484_002418 [Penicillium longicatenatum]KAJ5658769.1 hypothetical protein N7484_002418 [Penicillium longicatenatum]